MTDAKLFAELMRAAPVTASPAHLMAHFARISDAPDAIARLRRFILDLAVRGKLVEQDPSDEPASELLKHIGAERARLVNEKEIRKEKLLPQVEPDEVPFRAPCGWQWVRIRNVTSNRGQTKPDKDFTYIDVTAVDKESGRVVGPKVLSASEAPSRARKLVRKGDVIYSCVRPYLLNIAVIESDIIPAPIASTAFAIVNGFGFVLSQYLWIALRSPFMVECVEEKMRGQAYPAINDSDFARLPLPLPPLAEQYRIVAKVVQLMALCDRLEAAQAERERRRDRLVVASLHRLNQPTNGDAAAFREHARFHLSYLPRLTTRTEHIQQLRQTILSLAVGGKLVAGSHRQWSLGRVADFLSFLNGYAFKSSWFLKEGIRLCRNANVGHGVLDWTETARVSESHADEFHRFSLSEGDIVLSLDRPIISTGLKIAIVGKADLPCLLLQRVAKPLFDPQKILSAYLFLWFKSPAFTDVIDPGRSNGVPHISTKQVLALEFALPPLAEQRRIVAKVDELTALCGRLQGQLTTAEAESRRLLDAVLREVLAPTRTA